MRIVAEPLYKTSQLLVRLLGADVPTGKYTLDATPVVPEAKSFDVFSGMIRQEEARLYFTGFASFPETVRVVLPDLTEQVVPVVEVVQPKPQDFTIAQAEETITPVPKSVFQAPDTSKIETVAPPEIPKLWFELSLESINPLNLGNRVSAPVPTYQGGMAGRALTDSVVQPEANFPPYLLNVAPRFEGAWTNSLANSDLQLTEKKSYLFDAIPQGWDLLLTRPNDLLRVLVAPNTLPSIKLTWRAEESDRSAGSALQRLQLVTPPIASDKTFQIIVSPSASNQRGGYLKLISATGKFSSSDIYLEPGLPRSARLFVGDDPGPVRIVWFQPSENDNQTITVLTPMATTYDSQHTWGPAGTSFADVLEVTPISYEARRWTFAQQGFIRVDSDVESRLEPISWTLDSTLGPTVLRVEAGYLSSSFASSTINLTDYLPSETAEAGNYKIKWSSEGGLRFISREQPGGINVPFALDLPVPEAVKEAPLKLQIKSFASNRGSGVLRYFGFFPK